MKTSPLRKLAAILIFAVGCALPVINSGLPAPELGISMVLLAATLTGPMFLPALFFGMFGTRRAFFLATAIAAVGSAVGFWIANGQIAAGGADGQSAFGIFLLYPVSFIVFILATFAGIKFGQNKRP